MSLEDHPDTPISDIIASGYRRFRSEAFPAWKGLYHQLAQGQSPRICFITCSDSRVVPSIILSSDPGDIFECQIVGNIIPAYGDIFGGVSATLEYAVTCLKVQAIIICGHSDCGAMKAVFDSEQYAHLPAIVRWLHHADAAKRIVGTTLKELNEHEALQLLTRENVIAQLQNIRTHPAIAAGRRRGLKIFGWVYDIGSGEVEIYDEQIHSFIPLDTAPVL